MGQAEALVALEGSAKAGGKAFLLDLCKTGGALELELAAVSASLPDWAKGLEAVLAPMAIAALKQIADKL